MAEFWLIAVGLIFGRLLVGGMLVLAGVLKLKAGPRWFLQQILAYELVKGRMAWLLARGLPWAEIVCGVLLIVGLLTPLVAVVSFALLWGFTAAVVSTFLRGKPVDCGCFGRQPHSPTQQAQWVIACRNLGLMALLILSYLFGPGSLSLDGWLYPSITSNILVVFGLFFFWNLALLAVLGIKRKERLYYIIYQSTIVH